MAIYEVYYSKRYYKEIELSDEQMKQINKDYTLDEYLWEHLNEEDESEYLTVLNEDFSFDIERIIENDNIIYDSY